MGWKRDKSLRTKAFFGEVAKGRRFTEYEASCYLRGVEPKPPKEPKPKPAKKPKCCVDRMVVPDSFKLCVDCPRREKHGKD